MNERIIRKIVEQTGMSEKLARNAFNVLDNYRLENGDKAFRELLTGIREVGEEAERDGVPLSTLLEAKIRRPS
jgi:hypothetical protein